MEVPKAIRHTGAVLGCIGAFAATEYDNSAPAHDEAGTQGSVPAEMGGSFEEQMQQYQRELHQYCGELAVVGAEYRVSIHGRGAGLARIRGRTLSTQDADCDDIVERNTVKIDIVERQPNGRNRQVSIGRVEAHGEGSDRFDRRFRLRGFRRGQNSRNLFARQRISTEIEGDIVDPTADVDYSKRLKQTK